jgi:hypothetical protein
MKYISSILFLLLFVNCSNSDKKKEIAKKRINPTHIYSFVDTEKIKLNYHETDYLPVYSDIYQQDGTQRCPITITVSIRNTSLIDSAYIQSSAYYDSSGDLLLSYIDSTILLTPLESIEFVVEEKEKDGGAGANFIVEWAATKYSDQILIQAIMVNTYNGFSFQTNSKVIMTETK